MKLDVNVLRYLSKEDFRVLTSVEMGQKNVCIKLDSSKSRHTQKQQLTALGITRILPAVPRAPDLEEL